MSNKWYSAGLHFECLGCGKCCSGPEQGYIWVTRPEIKIIADFLKLPLREIRRKFLKRIGFRFSIIEHPATKDCIFLKNINGRKVCEIYPVRPSQCRNWPFWPVNLESPYNWNIAAVKCPGINKGKFYNLEQIESLKKQKRWWDNEKDVLVAEKVSEIYEWLDEQIASNKNSTDGCAACGRCCNFKEFDHLLFVTTPELIYLKNSLYGSLKQMSGGICPYNKNGKCFIYSQRFAGCRIFFCKSDKDIQSSLSEQTLTKFKLLCQEFDIPYIYSDLQAALNKTILQLETK
jgi:Fe-S-cluster containining protein